MAVRAEEAMAVRAEEARAVRAEEARAEEAMAARAEEACQRGSVSGSIGDTTAVQVVKAMDQALHLLYGSSTWE